MLDAGCDSKRRNKVLQGLVELRIIRPLLLRQQLRISRQHSWIENAALGMQASADMMKWLARNHSDDIVAVDEPKGAVAQSLVVLGAKACRPCARHECRPHTPLPSAGRGYRGYAGGGVP
jgi:hypothetical protein